MSEMFRNHLKHLLFNDAMIMHCEGCNHNAMDRSCVYDRFIDEIQNPEFDMIYETIIRRYYNERDAFVPEPTFPEHVPCIRHPQTGMPIPLPKSCIKMGVDYEVMEVLHKGGYWDSLEQADEYVNEYATDEKVKFLMSKIYEDPNSCEPIENQSQQEE